MAARIPTQAFRALSNVSRRSAFASTARGLATATRPALAISGRYATRSVRPAQQTRGLKTIDFAGTNEVVYGTFLTLLYTCFF